MRQGVRAVLERAQGEEVLKERREAQNPGSLSMPSTLSSIEFTS